MRSKQTAFEMFIYYLAIIFNDEIVKAKLEDTRLRIIMRSAKKFIGLFSNAYYYIIADSEESVIIKVSSIQNVQKISDKIDAFNARKLCERAKALLDFLSELQEIRSLKRN